MSLDRQYVTSCEQLFSDTTLDYTRIFIRYSDNINFRHEYEVSPSDYLRFAKSDVREGSSRGLLNALANAKRSIDCLIDGTLLSLGINPSKISENALGFCSKALESDCNLIQPNSLRLFCALGLAPFFLISEVRSLRNQMEHQYTLPDRDSVRRSIDVAELLISNVRAKEIYSSCIEISDQKLINTERGKRGYLTGLWFTERNEMKDLGHCKFELIDYSKGQNHYVFSGDEPIFYYLLRAMFVANHDKDQLCETLLQAIDCMPIKTPIAQRKIVDCVPG